MDSLICRNSKNISNKNAMIRALSLVALLGFLLFLSCGEASLKSDPSTLEKGTSFEKLSSEQTGIDFINHLVEDATTNHNSISFEYYYNGAGVAVGDVNNDGKPDIFFAANEGMNRLYLNEGDFSFRDITETAGINPPNKTWSTGAIMADVNGDGWLDIYVCQSGFKILPRDKRRNLLFINNGDNSFTERAAEYGVDDLNESVSAAFFDYDRDGDLDLYVLNESIYVRQPYSFIFEDLDRDPENLDRASGNLFRNDGERFTKVTHEAGLMRLGFGLGLSVSDINKDGWPDIYIANDYSIPDFMYINNGDGTFTDKIKEKTKQVSNFAMGTDINDYNNDGFPDIFVVDMAATDHIRSKTLMQSMNTDRFWFLVNDLGHQYQFMFNSLQLNNGNGTFSNIAALAGILKSEWSWAVLLADLDNDGWKDCYVTNGNRRYVLDNDFNIYKTNILTEYDGAIPTEMRQEIYDKAPEIKTQNYVYRNNKDLTFTEVGDDWNLDDLSYSNGAAYADLDGDGDLDLIVNNIDHEAFVYRNMNRENGGGNYIQFSLKGYGKNLNGYNAKVSLYYNDETQYQEFHPTRGYASSVDQMLHFGLGNIEKIDKVVVEWLDGKVQEISNVKVNQKMILDHADAVDKELPKSQLAEYAFEELDPEELGIDYVHRENEFNDFAKEVLLPHKQSTLGPMIAVGDVNGDGLDDLYIGGAHGQAGTMYVQQSDGKFKKSGEDIFSADSLCEDMDAHFFDANGDGRPDLYVASGGGGDMEAHPAALNDRLYLNTGSGGSVNWTRSDGLEESLTSSSVVVSGDMDGDGDPDLFVGGAAQPGNYPYPERSRILRNDGGKFKDLTEEYAPALVHAGSVKDAEWTDIDDNGTLDLVVVGEWMPVMVMLNDGNGTLTDASDTFGTKDLKGWWYSIKVADVNGDGKKDLIAGNVGQNIKFSASKKKPLHLFAGDFDDNGITDIVLSKDYKGKLVPTRGKECSSDQMPFIDEKFPTYKEFALAELDDILGEEKLSSSLHLEAYTFSSTVLINEGGKFKSNPLPNLAQIAPTNDIITEDFNGDGMLDILIVGNMYDTEVETPRYDAGYGLLLLGDGSGAFNPLPVYKSGFYAPGDVKDMALLNLVNGGRLVIVANNDEKPQVFRLSNNRMIGMAD